DLGGARAAQCRHDRGGVDVAPEAADDAVQVQAVDTVALLERPGGAAAELLEQLAGRGSCERAERVHAASLGCSVGTVAQPSCSAIQALSMKPPFLPIWYASKRVLRSGCVSSSVSNFVRHPRGVTSPSESRSVIALKYG